MKVIKTASLSIPQPLLFPHRCPAQLAARKSSRRIQVNKFDTVHRPNFPLDLSLRIPSTLFQMHNTTFTPSTRSPRPCLHPHPSTPDSQPCRFKVCHQTKVSAFTLRHSMAISLGIIPLQIRGTSYLLMDINV